MKGLKGIVLFCFSIFMFVSCSESANTDIVEEESIDESIEMLASVFDGPYSEAMIKEKMEILFLQYDIPLERNSYLKIGNELVALKKTSKGQYTEMDIIATLLESKSHDFGVSLNEQLVWTIEHLDNQYAINK